MENEVRILLCLVRLALYSHPSDNVETILEHISWESLYAQACRQCVPAIVLDAISKLPEGQRPPKALLLQWIGQTAAQEQRYERYSRVIEELAAFYKLHDIRALLLKGYGCSLCYPIANHRPTGDIDIYLFGKQEEADRLVEAELGISVHREYHKHSTFHFHGVEVENHAKFIDDVSHKSNISFERTLMQVLEETESLETPIDNVFLPSPTFNALFLLRHTGEHFAANEITLRHVLDVGTFFQKYHNKVDWKRAFGVYREQRMRRFFDAIATICVEYLGMDSCCFASDDGKYSYKTDIDLAERILSDIFEEKATLPMSTTAIDSWGKKLRYGIDKTRRWYSNRWKYGLVYNENMLESFWWLARNRMH